MYDKPRLRLPIRTSHRWRLADGGLAVVDLHVGRRSRPRGAGWQTIDAGPFTISARLQLSAPPGPPPWDDDGGQVVD
jgi:hypothetical protein